MNRYYPYKIIYILRHFLNVEVSSHKSQINISNASKDCTRELDQAKQAAPFLNNVSDNRDIIEKGGSIFGLIELARAIFTRVRNIYLGLVRTDLNVEEMSEIYDERVLIDCNFRRS